MRKIIVFCLVLCSFKLYAQRNTVTSGGMANGSGGSASYSIGQVTYTSLTGVGGSLIQGVQQPYEISVITNITAFGIDLKAQVYPNPVSDHLVLSVASEEYKNLRFTLVDVQGKVIKTGKIMSPASMLDFSSLSYGTYFLKVLYKNKQVKSFQIIKNQ